jgi:uncharacterized protein (DUF58 family)
MTSVDNNPLSSATIPITYPVDIEHNGIRLAGCGSFLVVTGLIFIISNALFPQATLFFALVSVLLGAFATYGIDVFLRGRWLSGRELHIDEQNVILRKNDNVEVAIQREQHANIIYWRFTVPRTGRVKKGWYVVACALQQDDDYLVVYSFCDPDTFEEMPHNHLFTRLEKRKSELYREDKTKDIA